MEAKRRQIGDIGGFKRRVRHMARERQNALQLPLVNQGAKQRVPMIGAPNQSARWQSVARHRRVMLRNIRKQRMPRAISYVGRQLTEHEDRGARGAEMLLGARQKIAAQIVQIGGAT